MIGTLIARDLKLSFKQGSGTVNLLLFFIITVTLFVFAIGPYQAQLQKLAPAIIWISALLSSLLTLDQLFSKDYEDGSLAQLWLQPTLPEWLIGAKLIAHWLSSGLLLTFITPLLGIMLSMHGNDIIVLSLSLLVGTPLLTLIGAIGAALALGSRRNVGLLPILTLPLLIPVIIFGVSSVGVQEGETIKRLLLLGGLSLGFIPLALLACVGFIRSVLNS